MITNNLNGEVMQFPIRHLDKFIGDKRRWIDQFPRPGMKQSPARHRW